MERRSNPFGISPGDLLMPAVLVIGGMVLLSKLKVPGNVSLNPIDWLGSSQRIPNSLVRLINVEHPPYPVYPVALSAPPPQPFQVTWTIEHQGPAERLTVGIALLGGIGGQWIEQFEESISAGNDAEWQRYSTGNAFGARQVMTVGAYLLAYVKDINGYIKDQRNV